MNNFLSDLFSDSSKVSSKRFAGLEVLQVIVVMVIGSQFTKYKLDYAVLIALITFVLSCFSINAALQAKAMNVKKDVASDIVNATGDSDTAKETLQSEKP